jgi:hypothetical protein
VLFDGVTQGSPSGNRANPGLNDFNPFRIEAVKLQRFEKRVIKSTENSEEPDFLCDVLRSFFCG